jgi:hypothetical protein
MQEKTNAATIHRNNQRFAATLKMEPLHTARSHSNDQQVKTNILKRQIDT